MKWIHEQSGAYVRRDERGWHRGEVWCCYPGSKYGWRYTGLMMLDNGVGTMREAKALCLDSRTNLPIPA